MHKTAAHLYRPFTYSHVHFTKWNYSKIAQPFHRMACVCRQNERIEIERERETGEAWIKC